MKVEVELHEIEALREELRNAKKESEYYKSELAKLDPNKLKDDAVRLSKGLLNSYIAAIFEKLGFEVDELNEPVRFKDDVQYHLGQAWYKSNRLEVEIGATITSNFKRAFLNLGLKIEAPE